MDNENSFFIDVNKDNKRVIFRKKEDLPPIKSDYVRLIHLTSSSSAEEIAQTGLDYSKYGMIQSMTTAYSGESDVALSANDPRFQGEHIVAVVMDISYEESRLHNDVANSPGLIPADHIIGIIPVIRGLF